MIFAFDIGGTSVRGAGVEGLRILGEVQRQRTPVRDLNAFVQCLADMIHQETKAPQHVAISIAGITDPETGLAICANIPCIHGLRLQEELEARLGIDVTISNDADCFTMAEAAAGAGQGHRVVLGAILGTGIGGGLVVDGQLVNSRGGYAGEWGHTPVAPLIAGTPATTIPAFPCGCGLSGCLETIASARGIEKLHSHLHGPEWTAEGILDAWAKNDSAAMQTMEIAIEFLSRHLAGAINLTGATVVPLGGGLSKDHRLIRELDARVRSFTLRKSVAPMVVAAQCHKEPALIGAVLLAKNSQKNNRDPSP